MQSFKEYNLSQRILNTELVNYVFREKTINLCTNKWCENLNHMWMWENNQTRKTTLASYER